MEGGLINSQRGFGVQATWPVAGGFAPRIPLDHCLHSPDLATVDRRMGPAVGSDHLPLVVVLDTSGLR